VSETDPLAAWDDLTARIYNDKDFSPGGREVALVLAWVMFRDESGDGHWKRAREILGVSPPPYPKWRLWEATAEDLPRYDPDTQFGVGGKCEGPRMRPYKPRRLADPDRCIVSRHHPHVGDCRYTQVWFAHEDDSVTDQPGPGHAVQPPDRDDRVCGAHGTIPVTEYDPVTGWESRHWFCARHKDRAREVKAQLQGALPEPPPPVPNRGGVLPRYFSENWPERYATAAKNATGHGSRGWEPPYHGVCRDDWPVPGKTTVPKRPRLAVVS
jgi:hypothetical protein